MRKLYIAIVIVIILQNWLSAGETRGAEAVIFPVFTGEMQHDEILKRCEFMAGEAFSASGRFYPVPHNRSEEYLRKSDGKDRSDLYHKAASAAGAELLCVLELTGDNAGLKLSIKMESADESISSIKSERIIRARIPANIAVKAGREIALLLEKEKLKCRVTGGSDGVYMLSAGQWHGLALGRYNTKSGIININGVARFTSSAEGADLKAGDIIEFDIYPDLKHFLKRVNREIDENTSRFYGTDASLNKRRGSAKESIIGTCIINQGASFCLPGYGSFLSVEYMGIEKGEADMFGVFTIGGITALHLTLPSMMNNFDINFLPWIMDDEKEKNDQRLQFFLWGSLPLTFSVSFYNQLAYQYQRKSLLPPLFVDHDATAAVVSVFVPGGGMFYKGYRLAGWFFYLSEMSAAGYAVYNWDKTPGKAAAGGLLFLKVLEAAVSYAVTPSYQVYRYETGRGGDYPDFSIGVKSGIGGSSDITLSATIQF